MLKKTCEFAEFKLSEEGSGSFSGYGSTFGTIDRAGEFVVKGAFQKSLSAFKENGFIAVGHQWDGLPVATISDASEDAKGLFIKCDFHSTDEAQQARKWAQERMARGKSVGLSIGYAVQDSEPTKSGLALKEIELFEVSLVTVPCNPAANATSVKAAPEAKAAYLGDVENSMCLAALSEAYWGLWSALYNGMEAGATAEDLGPAFDEFRDLCLGAYGALMAGSDEQPADTAGMLKNWLGEDNPQAGKSFDTQCETVRAAVEDCTKRAGEIASLRAKSGRTLSDARRAQLAALKSGIEALLDATQPKADPAEVLAAELSLYRRKSRLRVCI